MRFVAIVLLFAGCGAQQSAVCKKFIACEQAYEKASNTGPIDLSQYEANGVCWQSADNATKCDQQCTDGTTAVRQAVADANLSVPACN
jgi:hypothetical protein